MNGTHRLSEVVEVAETTRHIVSALVHMAERKGPEDFPDPNGQLPLFIGPCFYCGGGYVAQLPSPCPCCGVLLRGVVDPFWLGGLAERAST